MSHKVTSENGSVDEKQIGQLRNKNQNFSCPLHLFGGGGIGEGSGNLFEARLLLTFPPYRMGTYLRWVLNWKIKYI